MFRLIQPLVFTLALLLTPPVGPAWATQPESGEQAAARKVLDAYLTALENFDAAASYALLLPADQPYKSLEVYQFEMTRMRPFIAVLRQDNPQAFVNQLVEIQPGTSQAAPPLVLPAGQPAPPPSKTKDYPAGPWFQARVTQLVPIEQFMYPLGIKAMQTLNERGQQTSNGEHLQAALALHLPDIRKELLSIGHRNLYQVNETQVQLARLGDRYYIVPGWAAQAEQAIRRREFRMHFQAGQRMAYNQPLTAAREKLLLAQAYQPEDPEILTLMAGITERLEALKAIKLSHGSLIPGSPPTVEISFSNGSRFTPTYLIFQLTLMEGGGKPLHQEFLELTDNDLSPKGGPLCCEPGFQATLPLPLEISPERQGKRPVSAWNWST